MTARTRISLAALLFLLPLAVAARDPGGTFQVSEAANGEYRPAVSMDSSGEFVVAWAQQNPSVWARRFDRTAKPLGGEFQVDEGISYFVGSTSTALAPSGFLVVWDNVSKHGASAFEGRRFGRSAQSKSAVHGLAGFNGKAAADPQGNFLVVSSLGERGIFASRWSRRDPQPRSLRLTPKSGAPDVAAGGSDNFIVAWAGTQGIQGQRYSAAGQARGSGFQVAPGPFDPDPYRSRPAVAANGQGRFVVAWTRGTSIFARFYSPAGEPRTGPVLVTSQLPENAFFDAAMDAEGKVLVAWSWYAPGVPSPVLGRRFEASGAPAGGVFQVSPTRKAPGPVAVAAGPKDHFVVVWEEGEIPAGTVVGRRLAWARPGDDPCLFGRGTFVCDAAHDGGEEELLVRFGGGPGGAPLLGDLDGDGRDDPCVHRDGSFLCDTAHDGGAAELRLDFGAGVALGDFPLLGDLDGEGRDDPCVRRGNRFLCDSAHNGGTAELVVTFGDPGDVPLLGDVDGDGDDDPCLAREGRLACDTRHDGGTAELTLPLDLKPRDVLLLGDVDGDGDEDPCVYRNNRFLCDTTRDGKADLVIPFGGPGMVPVLGNVDGI